MSESAIQATISAADMTDEQKAALRRLLLNLADTKRLLGIRYSDWLLGAPSIETGIAASSMCQDEWGHGRLLYAMLKDLGEDPTAVEHDRPAEEYGSAAALDTECPDWPTVVAMTVVVDGAASAALQAFGSGSYEMARNRVPKMLAEEEFHRDFGRAWLKSLTGSDEAKAVLRDAVLQALPSTLAWLTPEDGIHGTLVDAGITEPGSALRRRFEEDVADLLQILDIDLSAMDAEREGWDADRGRGPGGPDEDAIARARGDKNRDLFVE